MTFGDFKVLAKGLKTVYASDNFLEDENALKIWYSLLGDYPYEVLNVAIQKYMLTNKFPPTIADLRGIATELTKPSSKDWGESWGEVLKLIRKYGYANPEGAYSEMDEATRETIKRLGWRELCLSENPSVERANFRKIYEGLAERNKSEAVLTFKVKDAIDKITGNKIKQIGEIRNE